MAKRSLILTLIFLGFLAITGFSQEEKEKGNGLLVLREAQRQGDNSAAVEAYLAGKILEVTVSARTYGAHPVIQNTTLIGPGIDRISPNVKKSVYATVEESDFFSNKKYPGTLIRELYKFNIPEERIVPGKDYELRVIVQRTEDTGEPARFSFILKGFPELILKQKKEGI